MSLSILTVQIVAVIRRHERDGEFMTKLLEQVIDGLLLREQVGLYFKIEAVLIKDGGEDPRLRLCLFASVGVEEVRDPPFQAGGQSDQPGVVFPEKLHIHPGVIIESFKMGESHQAAEVLVSFLVHGKKDQVVSVRAPILRQGAVLPVAGGDIHLTSQEGFDSLVRALGEKLHGAEDIPVVRDSDGFHVERASLVQELADPDRAVEQAEFGMNMKVYE